MDELDLRRIPEASYLNTDNTWRYRSILHFCFKRHEHMQTYVYPEDIFHYLKQEPHFREYTFDQLEQDLAALCDWNNLIPHQETSRSRTIADFKKKRYRYQCSPYTVEIERMLERLRHVGEEFGGSLETTQFDRILQCLKTFLFPQEELPAQELYQTWQDLEHYFRTLVQNSSDYLASRQQLADLMEGLAVEGVIDFEKLPALSREARQMLLGWVARALHRNPVSTEMGFGVELVYDPKEKRRITIHCEDGDFAMPPMKFKLHRGN